MASLIASPTMSSRCKAPLCPETTFDSCNYVEWIPHNLLVLSSFRQILGLDPFNLASTIVQIRRHRKGMINVIGTRPNSHGLAQKESIGKENVDLATRLE